MFQELSKHIHIDAVYSRHRSKLAESRALPIDYTQILKDFKIECDQVERRVIVMAPLEMDYEETDERY